MSAGLRQIGVQRNDAIHVHHGEYLRHGTLCARQTHLAALVFHVAAATHQHSDARAIDGVQLREIDHHLAHAAINEAPDRVFDGNQQIAQAKTPGDLEDRNIRPNRVCSGFGNHWSSHPVSENNSSKRTLSSPALKTRLRRDIARLSAADYRSPGRRSHPIHDNARTWRAWRPGGGWEKESRHTAGPVRWDTNSRSSVPRWRQGLEISSGSCIE